MSGTARKAAIKSISRRIPQGPVENRVRTTLTDVFGMNVFNDVVQRKRLPKDVYRALRRTVDAGASLQPEIADVVAAAMKDWAVERGATHYTHWFQPMTGLTAEKHDSFITPTGDDRVINDFSGKELVQGEPDASSFPSGGLRATFEARGYTAWDPTSPAFLKDGSGGATLCIPTAFCSWTGEALDKKTPLLRSEEAIGAAAVRLLKLLGNEHADRVWSTTGPEQEYFLIDAELAALRPDILCCGRTLFGGRPPKGQEMDDHYFGAISQRVIAFMQEHETEAWKLGIPCTTRHNEVAPMQFETAPVYERSSVAADHNMLLMEVLKNTAERHGLKCLMHEKPFAGINGSGKHTNWSLEDSQGNNLLEPGHTPHENLQFIMVLTAIIRAVDIHADLLRVTMSGAGNDHRLGANEAPPAIISIFLGTQLEAIVRSLAGEQELAANVNSSADIELGVSALPSLPKDISDRNRTSPFAFTGNKFEFRAIGSSRSIAYPCMVLNTIVADSINFMVAEVENRKGEGDRRSTMQSVVSEILAKHNRVLFGGDNYSAEWPLEAERRGLPHIRSTAEALVELDNEKNQKLFESLNVLSKRELASRRQVLEENYALAIGIEAQSTHQIASTQILPVAIRFERDVADTINAKKSAAPDLSCETEIDLLKQSSNLITGLHRGLNDLEEAINALDGIEDDTSASAVACRDQIIPAMSWIRDQADKLEGIVDDELWPLPKYREMLFMN